jgi:hypothetical protein
LAFASAAFFPFGDGGDKLGDEVIGFGDAVGEMVVSGRLLAEAEELPVSLSHGVFAAGAAAAPEEGFVRGGAAFAG